MVAFSARVLLRRYRQKRSPRRLAARSAFSLTIITIDGKQKSPSAARTGLEVQSWCLSDSGYRFFIERRPFLVEPFLFDLAQLDVGDLKLIDHMLARFGHGHQALILRRDQRREDLAALLQRQPFGAHCRIPLNAHNETLLRSGWRFGGELSGFRPRPQIEPEE